VLYYLYVSLLLFLEYYIKLSFNSVFYRDTNVDEPTEPSHCEVVFQYMHTLFWSFALGFG